MTVRAYLALGLSAILCLFAVNLGVSLWGNAARDRSLGELSRALSRQILIGSIRQRLSDLQKETALVSQVYSESGSVQRDADDLDRLKARLDEVRKEIAQARDLAPVAWLGDFPRFFEDLALAWTDVHENLGVDNARAIRELSLRAEPLAQMLIGGLLREWESREKAKVGEARAELARDEAFVRRTTISIFLVSILLAVLVEYSVWRAIAPMARGPEKREGGGVR